MTQRSRRKAAIATLVAGALLAGVGIVLAVLPQPQSFGWFAYQPMADAISFGGAQLIPDSRLWGWALIVVAALLAAFAGGWMLGSQRPGEPSDGMVDPRG